MTKHDIEVIPGKIYFFDYGGAQVVGKVKEVDSMRYTFYDHFHYWNEFETFKLGGYCVTSGLEEIRRASIPERLRLVKKEIAMNLI